TALRRLWTRLVIKTVLPERLSPVTASQTVALPASSPRLLARRSDACTRMGGSQLRLIMGVILSRRRQLPPKWARLRRRASTGEELRHSMDGCLRGAVLAPCSIAATAWSASLKGRACQLVAL